MELVNAAQTQAELTALRRSGRRGWPFREALSSDQFVRCLGLEMTRRPLRTAQEATQRFVTRMALP